MGTITISLSGCQSCNWSRSGPFCWQNPCSGYNSGFDMVVVLEYTFFQLCCNIERKFFRFTRFIRSYVNHPAIVLTNHCQSYTAFLLGECCSKLPCSIFLQLFVPNDSTFALLSIPVARMFWSPRWVGRWTDVK